jgi:CO/xanthine dehydrogenase Mo-binding subunit
VTRFKVVGQSVPRLDGNETVTGSASYTVDVLVPGTLHANIVSQCHSGSVKGLRINSGEESQIHH